MHAIDLTRPRRRAAFAALLAVAACGGPSSEPASDELPEPGASETEWTPTPAQLERATELGRSAAGRLAGTLVQQLTEQMEQGGPESAIEFCSGQAMPLTASVNDELGGLEVKRTSSRVRNPDNAPDALERAALDRFEAAAEAGELPASWVQTAGDHELRYYQPLVVNEMCARCHGAPEDLAPAVRARLEALYPTDQAVGYAPGDFRGLIRVAVPREALDG